tara:strand:+ start:382 stop:624 length:243 start_codon:yes stop_codon:yes gene_type:complete
MDNNLQNNNLEDKINNLEKEIKIINEKLDRLVNLIEKDVKEDCKKMSNHIDFIEKVYENVQSPMYYICDKLNNLKSITYG